MNTIRSVGYGWGVLCLAGGGAYYFAKRSINSDRAERAAAEEKRRQQREKMRAQEMLSRETALGEGSKQKAARTPAPNSNNTRPEDPAPVAHAADGGETSMDSHYTTAALDIVQSIEHPTPMPAQSVDTISAALREGDADTIARQCQQISACQWRLDEQIYLQDTHDNAEKNELAKLVALTATPHVARSLKEIIIIVPGPQAEEDVVETTTLETRPVTLGWQAQLKLRWSPVTDDEGVEVAKTVEMALKGLMGVLGFYRARPTFRIGHDRGWERFLPVSDPRLAGRRDCGVLLAPFLPAWTGTGYDLRSLEVVGDAGTAPLNLKSALRGDKGKAFTSLRSLQLDLNQRDTSQPPHTLISLLAAAVEIETIAIRCNIAPAAASAHSLGLVAKAVTRRHAIRDAELIGLHCTTGDLRELLQRIRATLRNQELGRLELSNVVLVDGSGWEDLLRPVVRSL